MHCYRTSFPTVFKVALPKHYLPTNIINIFIKTLSMSLKLFIWTTFGLPCCNMAGISFFVVSHSAYRVRLIMMLSHILLIIMYFDLDV